MVSPSVREEQWSPYRGQGYLFVTDVLFPRHHLRFSSKAESHMFRLWGADVVNMTSIPEVQPGCELSSIIHHLHQVVLAKEAGLPYAAIAMPTDYDCWKEGQVVDVTSVMEVTLTTQKYS